MNIAMQYIENTDDTPEYGLQFNTHFQLSNMASDTLKQVLLEETSLDSCRLTDRQVDPCYTFYKSRKLCTAIKILGLLLDEIFHYFSTTGLRFLFLALHCQAMQIHRRSRNTHKRCMLCSVMECEHVRLLMLVMRMVRVSHLPHYIYDLTVTCTCKMLDQLYCITWELPHHALVQMFRFLLTFYSFMAVLVIGSFRILESIKSLVHIIWRSELCFVLLQHNSIIKSGQTSMLFHHYASTLRQPQWLAILDIDK